MWEIFYGILLVSQNIVMEFNNVMKEAKVVVFKVCGRQVPCISCSSCFIDKFYLLNLVFC